MQKEAKTLVAIGAAILFIGIGVLLWWQQNTALNDSKPVDGSKLIRTDSQIIGKIDAPNTLVEFGDYQCPACKAAHPILKQFMKDKPDRIRLVFRNFPLSQHKNGYPGSQAAEAAGKQGKYEAMHDLLYEKQDEWAALPKPDDKFYEYATSLGLDLDKFKSDYSGSFMRTRIQADVDDGSSLGVNSTPTFFLNGEKLEGWNFTNLAQELEKKLK